MNVSAKLRGDFPGETTKLSLLFDGKRKQCGFNPKYGRITGLTEFYRSHSATAGDRVEVVVEQGTYRLNFLKVDESEKNVTVPTSEEAEEIIQVSEISSVVKGNVVEGRIAELILLYGQGLLNVYKPIADVEGVDLIVVKKGCFHPLFIQVKSRFNLRGKSFQIALRKMTFTPHHLFFIVGAYFNPVKMDIDDRLVLIPSIDFSRLSVSVNKDTDRETMVLNTPFSDSYTGKYAPYIFPKFRLVDELLEKFQELEKHYR
ncbi:MAG: hypothetical protein AAB416_04545 [Patescibacteria group bacterium]